MGCVALVRCVLVLRCGLAGVVWCGIRMEAETLVVLGWCGIRMQAEALLVLGWCGIPMQAEAVLVLQPTYGHHTTPAKPQRNTNTHWTRAIQPTK